MKNRIEVRLFRQDPYDSYAIWIKQDNMFTDPITIKTEHKPGDFHEPAFRIEAASSQILMDDLWNAGFRPTKGKEIAGSLSATQYHLKDMRKLVAHHLKILL